MKHESERWVPCYCGGFILIVVSKHKAPSVDYMHWKIDHYKKPKEQTVNCYSKESALKMGMNAGEL